MLSCLLIPIFCPFDCTKNPLNAQSSRAGYCGYRWFHSAVSSTATNTGSAQSLRFGIWDFTLDWNVTSNAESRVCGGWKRRMNRVGASGKMSLQARKAVVPRNFSLMSLVNVLLFILQMNDHRLPPLSFVGIWVGSQLLTSSHIHSPPSSMQNSTPGQTELP